MDKYVRNIQGWQNYMNNAEKTNTSCNYNIFPNQLIAKASIVLISFFRKYYIKKLYIKHEYSNYPRLFF